MLLRNVFVKRALAVNRHFGVKLVHSQLLQGSGWGGTNSAGH